MGRILDALEEDEFDPVIQKSLGFRRSTWKLLDEALTKAKKKKPEKKLKLNKLVEGLVLYALREDASSEGGKR